MIEKDWKPSCTKLIDKACTILLNQTLSITKKSFASHLPMLEVFVKNLINEAYQTNFGELTQGIAHALDIDMTPYTQNHYLFEVINKKRNSELQQRIIRQLKNIKTFNCDEAKSTAIITVNSAFPANECKSVDEHLAQELEIRIRQGGHQAHHRSHSHAPVGF